MPACTNCGYQSNFLLKCGGCRQTRYCGITCQEEGWGKHQEECSRTVEKKKEVFRRVMKKKKGKSGNTKIYAKDEVDNEVD